MAVSKRFGWAAALLALAFPAAAGTLLVLVLAHLSLVCTVAAGVLLVSTLPSIRHRCQSRALRRLRGLAGRVAS